MVRVTIIAAKAVPVANAMAHHCGPTACKNNSPTSELIKCPATKFQGRENGERG